MSQNVVSDEKLKDILKISEIGLWEFNMATGELRCSAETLRVFGLDPEEGLLTIDAWMQAVHPEDLSRVQRMVEQGFDESLDVVYRVVRADGQVRTVWSHGGVLGDRPSRCLAGTVQDITDREQYSLSGNGIGQRDREWLLRYTTKRYESLKRYNPNGVCSLDRYGRVLGINPAFERMTGYSLPDLAQANLWETLFAPEDVEWAQMNLTSTLVENVELTIQSRAGHPVDVSLTNVPIVIDGETVGVYIMLTDITQQKRDRQRLLEVQRLYQLISENSQEIISSSTPDGICRYVSPSIRELLGYAPSEFIGQPSHQFFHPDDVDYVTAVGRRILKGEDVNRFTSRVRLKSGNYRWYETTLKVVRDSRGRVLQVVGVGRDVSEQMNLQESFEHAVRIAGLGHWDWVIDNGTVNFSPQMYQILGLERRPEGVTYDQLMSFVDQRDLELVELSIKKSIETGNPFDRVFRIVRSDGEHHYLHGQGEVLFDEFGTPLRMIGTFQDITRQIRLETQLRESTERYQRLVNNSLDAIGIFEDGKWVFINQAGVNMFGAESEAQIVGQSCYDFLHPDHHETFNTRVQALLLGKHTGVTEYQWMKLNGELFHAEVFGVPFGQTAVQIIIRDLTDRKQAEETIMRQEKLAAVGQLAAGIAHEIRNPLTALKGFTQLLLGQTDEGNQQYFEIMQGELTRIEDILNELLLLAKPQEMNCRPTDIGSLLDEVKTLLEAQATLHSVVMENVVAGQVPMVNCDANQLKQVLINIVKNGIEAMPEGGNLTVQLSSAEDKVRITCTDTGKGIAKDQLAKLGTPFFSTKKEGTGLGLMVSQKIIESHHGRLKISSEVGQGTAVSIVLPAHSS
ncbi:PAS domain S-box protein [Alicyclobacillus tolerans]|uniref:PAS domain-containing sensor histidine kinase n=1 Tax=Alicyclobacillus tolerans TaxID=90970 RepID=UPI001F47C61E|nr:PAS domain-containing sensor histidine kinase [Alicyclobacillus tolerans]MCF8564887.1 PAS domain S-box protein [Alicyclobacillus tolerans]